jgi:hypothetical protein
MSFPPPALAARPSSRPLLFGLPLAGLVLFGLVPAALPGTAQAQVRHCVTSEGVEVFTDRRCADLGATERLPRDAAGSTGAMRLRRSGCARNLQDLVYEMTAAIDARDANRLAGVYHWVGISSGTSAGLMQQLETIVQRPLVDIVPVTPGTGGEEARYYPTTIPARQPPVALRLEQTLANGSTPSSTVFGLRRHFDCWWITL